MKKNKKKEEKIKKNSEFWNPKGFAKFKRICREFFDYKLILLLTRKRTNRK